MIFGEHYFDELELQCSQIAYQVDGTRTTIENALDKEHIHFYTKKEKVKYSRNFYFSYISSFISISILCMYLSIISVIPILISYLSFNYSINKYNYPGEL